TVQAIVAKVISAEPERPTLVRKSLPSPLEQAVLRALAKLPADRFSTATAFADALREAPRTTDAAVPRLAPARPRIDWRLALAAGLVLGAAAAIPLVARRTPTARAGFMRTQVTFNGQTGLPAITPNGDVLAYVRLECEQPGHSGFPFLAGEAPDPVPCRA